METVKDHVDYYKQYAVRYMIADETTRKASKDHWTKCHARNIASGREDLIIFSAKILAAIALADTMI